jgi:DNA-binding transcriptional LysR family regulator
MEWDDLKHFLAVARCGSLTEAARGLKSSPATVGRRVAALEDQLGIRLFDRKLTGYSLTESGEAIRLKAEEMEQAVWSIEREAFGRDLRATGKVRVTTAPEMAALIIGPNLAQFRNDLPGVTLDIAASTDVVNLTRREADIALRTVRPTHGDFVIRHVGWWNLGLYAAKTYADSHGLQPGLSDLAKAEIITWNEESAQWRGGAWFYEHARDARTVLEANTRRVHHAACRAGLGVAILPCLLADADSELICLLSHQQVISAELLMIVHRDLIRVPRVRAVMDFLADVCPKTTGSIHDLRTSRERRRPRVPEQTGGGRKTSAT